MFLKYYLVLLSLKLKMILPVPVYPCITHSYLSTLMFMFYWLSIELKPGY